jgi:hypothetical protein
MTRRRWLVLLLVFALGMAGGLYYAWLVKPLQPTNTAPASLRQDYRTDYVILIAAAYSATGDLERAQSRLAWLSDTDPATALAALAQELSAAGASDSEARALALLASALGEHPLRATSPSGEGGTVVLLSPSPEMPNTPTTAAIPLTPTPRPQPTHTPTPIPASSFALVSLEMICDLDLAEPLIQVEVRDADANPLSGVEILVVWDTGQDFLFTGLKPELGLGYADFSMEQGVMYTAQIVGSNEPVTGLSVEDCTQGGETFPASWLLTFELPSP